MTTLGITSRLSTPGLPVTPTPVEPIPNVSALMDQLLGSAAGATRVAAIAAERKRGVAFRDNMNKAVSAIMSGERRKAFTDPKVQDFYDSGLAWTDSLGFDPATVESRPGETPGDAMRRWVEANSPGMSDRYKYELFRHNAPKYATDIRARAQEQRELLVNDGASALAGRLAADADLAAWTADFKTWEKLADGEGWTEDAKLRAVYLPAADAVATRGNVLRAREIAKRIKGRLPGVAEATVQKAQSVRTHQVSELIREKIRENESPNWSPAPLKTEIEALGNRDILTESQVKLLGGELKDAVFGRFSEEILGRKRRGESEASTD